jgi:hypothetical protein
MRGILPPLNPKSRKLPGEFPRGFGAIEVVDACAYRSTDSRKLFKVRDPVGTENWKWIKVAVQDALLTHGIVICGWVVIFRR